MTENLTRRNFLKGAFATFLALGLGAEFKAFGPENPEKVLASVLAEIFKETEPKSLAEKLARFVLEQGKFFSRAADLARKNFGTEIPDGMNPDAVFYISRPSNTSNSVVIGFRSATTSDWMTISASEGKYGPWMQLTHLKGSSSPQTNGVSIAALVEFGLRDDQFSIKKSK